MATGQEAQGRAKQRPKSNKPEFSCKYVLRHQHKAAIRSNVARLLELGDQQVNVKATTEEHLGFTGRKEGIKAVAVVTATRKEA